jgi:hypothetical protein
MFATAIAAWRRSGPLNRPRSRLIRAIQVLLRSRLMSTACPRGVDRVDQRPRGDQPIQSEPIRWVIVNESEEYLDGRAV